MIREWLGAGVVFLAVAAALAIGGSKETRRGRILVGVLLLLCLALYWRTPYGGDNGTHGWRVTPWIEVGLRYAFPAFALIGALGAAGMSRVKWAEWAGLAVLVVTSVFTVLEHLVPHIAVLVFVVLVAWALAILAQGFTVRRGGLAAAAVIVFALVVVGMGLARADREARREAGFGRIVGVLATELVDDDVVAVVNSQKLHIAAGMDWRRRVELAEIPEPGQESRWVDALRARGVTALLVGHQPPPPELADDVARVQAYVRESGRFILVDDYESLAKDLALFRLTP